MTIPAIYKEGIYVAEIGATNVYLDITESGTYNVSVKALKASSGSTVIVVDRTSGTNTWRLRLGAYADNEYPTLYPTFTIRAESGCRIRMSAEQSDLTILEVAFHKVSDMR